MNILFLSGWFPYLPDKESKIRIYNFLRALCEHLEVNLLSVADPTGVPEDVPEIQAIYQVIQIVPTATPWLVV